MYDLKSNTIRLFQKIEIWKWYLLKSRKQMKAFAKVYNRMYSYWTIDIAVNEKYTTISNNCVFLSFHVRGLIESVPCNCLNVKELFAQSRLNIWKLSDCKVTRTYNHLVNKSTTNNLAKVESLFQVTFLE